MTYITHKTLLNHNENTPCKDIFQAACDEIGAYYVREKGFKYTPSRPKLVFETGEYKLEIAFFSTRTNVQGQSVTLQVLPVFYAKSSKNTENPKGILTGYPDLFYHPTDEMPPKMTINHIYGEVEFNTESWITESVIRDYHACDVYGLTEEKFHKILVFIDAKIIAKFEELMSQLTMKKALFNLELFNPKTTVFPKMVFKKKFDTHLFMNLEDWFNNAEDYNDLQCFMQAINEPYLYCAVPDFYNFPDLKFDISKSHAEFVAAYTTNKKDKTNPLGMRNSPEGFWYGQSGDWAIVSDLMNNIYIVGLNRDAALNFKADFPDKYFDANEYIKRQLKANSILGNDIDKNDTGVIDWMDAFVKMYH
jgi:hypothetical protein